MGGFVADSVHVMTLRLAIRMEIARRQHMVIDFPKYAEAEVKTGGYTNTVEIKKKIDEVTEYYGQHFLKAPSSLRKKLKLGQKNIKF